MLDQPLWQFALATVLTVVGVYALLLGRFHWRRGRERRCAKCEYELQGLPETSTRCPECGSDLTRRRAVIYGITRGKRISRLIALLLLVAVGWWWTKLISADDLLYIQPVWVMTRNVRGQDQIRSQKVLARLTKQIEEGRLWGWQVRGLVERAMADQRDLARPWVPGWQNVVQSAYYRNRISKDLFYAYLADSLAVEVAMKQKIVADHDLKLTIRVVESRQPTVSAYYQDILLDQITINGVAVDPKLIEREAPRWSWNYSPQPHNYQISALALRHLPPGEQKLTASVRIFDRAADIPELRSEARLLRQMTQQISSTLLSAGSETITLDRDPAKAATIRNALVLEAFDYGQGQSFILLTSGPMSSSTAFNIKMRTDKTERGIGIASVTPRRPLVREGFDLRGIDLHDPAGFEVVLSPSVELAREIPDIDVAWVGPDLVYIFPPLAKGQFVVRPTTQPMTQPAAK